MAVIDRSKLVDDAILYLPAENVLTQEEIAARADFVVDNKIPADDSVYEGEALYKLLRDCALLNKTKSLLYQGIKRDKTGGQDLEWFESSVDIWTEYLKMLPAIAGELFGYVPPKRGLGGMNIHLSPTTIEDPYRKKCPPTLTL